MKHRPRTHHPRPHVPTSPPPIPPRLTPHTETAPMPEEEGTDESIQQASDMMTQRSPDEDSGPRDYYGPDVPARPMNVQRYIDRSRARQASAEDRSDPPYRSERNYGAPEPGVEPSGGGRPVNTAPSSKSPRWQQRMRGVRR